MIDRKYTKKAIGGLVVASMMLLPMHTFSDLEFKVSSIDVLDESTLEIGVNQDLAEELDSDTDMQVIEDTQIVESITRDYEDFKKVEVKLSDELEPGDYYSLISIYGADGNIAFIFPENFYDEESVIIPGEEESGIVSIEITNSKNIIVNLENEADSDIEMKLIRELGVNNLEKTGEKNILITLDKKMLSEKDYTLTVIKLASIEGKEISLENSTVDFISPNFEPEIELNSAGDEVVTPVAKELPPTGTKENIIIILSMIIAGVIVFRKNKKQA